MTRGFLPSDRPQFLPKKPGGYQPRELCREVTMPVARVQVLKERVFKLIERVIDLEGGLKPGPPERR